MGIQVAPSSNLVSMRSPSNCPTSSSSLSFALPWALGSGSSDSSLETGAGVSTFGWVNVRSGEVCSALGAAAAA